MKKWQGALAAIIAGTAFVAAPASAAVVINSFSTVGLVNAGPEGIALDPVTGNLILVSSSAPDETGNQFQIVEVTRTGALVDSDVITGLNSVEGATFSGGKLLISNSATGAASGIHEFDLVSDTINGGGVRIVTDPPSGDADGVAVEPGTGNFFVADDIDEEIHVFDPTGVNLAGEVIDTTAIDPEFDEPEGVAFDPLTGNLFVADDQAGTGSIFEIDTSGNVIQQIVIAGFDDPEGLEFDPNTRTLLIADDANEAVIEIDPFTSIPEPTSLALFGAGLAGLGFAAWRRRRAHTA